jgi:hypothetical protein
MPLPEGWGQYSGGRRDVAVRRADLEFVEKVLTAIQGLSKLDILRCLKRYIAREVYPTSPTHHPPPLPLAPNRRHPNKMVALLDGAAREHGCDFVSPSFLTKNVHPHTA